jgi:hypothetical protein
VSLCNVRTETEEKEFLLTETWKRDMIYVFGCRMDKFRYGSTSGGIPSSSTSTSATTGLGIGVGGFGGSSGSGAMYQRAHHTPSTATSALTPTPATLPLPLPLIGSFACSSK